MHKRKIEDKIKSDMWKGKIQIVYGGRQVGKTTLVKKIAKEEAEKIDSPLLFLSGEDREVREKLSVNESSVLREIFADYKIIVIDEAQKIPNIGLTLKIAYDMWYWDGIHTERQILVTGSSAFDLKNRLSEPMTGRCMPYNLHPIALSEMKEKTVFEFKQSGTFDRLLKYGSYPEVLSLNIEDAKVRLEEIVESTLYKDVFVMEGVKKPEILSKLVKYLAINISQTVTVRGMATDIGTTSKTVENYLDLLEKVFVIKRLYSLSRNKNNELKRGLKVYFVDVGFRNAVLKNFNDYDTRTDIGQVFENFFVMERIKHTNYNSIYCNRYFWQDHKGYEVDYIEERDGTLTGFECKWKDRKSRGVKVFEEVYKDEKAKVEIVTRENYLEYLR